MIFPVIKGRVRENHEPKDQVDPPGFSNGFQSLSQPVSNIFSHSFF